MTIAACGALAQQPRFIRISGGERPFSIAQTETTVEQFTAFVRATGYQTDAEKAASPRTWKAPGFRIHRKQPVVYVTPADAMAYCEFVEARLPADAEWEYAARAGATTRHYWGNSIDDRYLWYRANSDDHPHTVATKLPNKWGLYDVEGNVWEWALSPSAGHDAVANRRGGSWIDCEDIDGGPRKRPGQLIALSLGYKISVRYGHRYDDIGFRCARSHP